MGPNAGHCAHRGVSRNPCQSQSGGKRNSDLQEKTRGKTFGVVLCSSSDVENVVQFRQSCHYSSIHANPFSHRLELVAAPSSSDVVLSHWNNPTLREGYVTVAVKTAAEA